MAAEKKNKFRGGETAETLVEIEERSIAQNDIVDVVEKKTTERKNKPKSAPKTTETKTAEMKAAPTPVPAKSPQQKISLGKRFEQFLVFYNDERTQKIIGLLLILFSAYLSINASTITT